MSTKDPVEKITPEDELSDRLSDVIRKSKAQNRVLKKMLIELNKTKVKPGTVHGEEPRS